MQGISESELVRGLGLSLVAHCEHFILSESKDKGLTVHRLIDDLGPMLASKVECERSVATLAVNSKELLVILLIPKVGVVSIEP